MNFLKGYTREEKSWMMYDWANSAHTICVCTILPIFFTTVAGYTENGQSTITTWGYATSIAMVIVALLAPVLGALGDFQGLRKKLFTGFMLIGVVSCLALSFSPLMDFTSSPEVAGIVGMFILVMYITSTIGFNAANLYYDAFLTDVTTDERIDQVSTLGYGMGYIGGSTIPLVIFLVMCAVGIDILVSMAVIFALTGIWWLVFSIPLLRYVRQRGGTPASRTAVARSFTGIVKTAREILANKAMFFFILAYFFYIDGVHTIIAMSTTYGANLGLDDTSMLLALLLVQVLGLPFCLLYIEMAKKFGARKMVGVAIGVYSFICIFAFFMTSIWQFWVLAVLCATSQGGIQALSRSMFSRMIPDKDHAGEYFGFFDIFGKVSSIMGPALCGFISAVYYTKLASADPSLSAADLNRLSAPYGILSIIVLFIIGGALYFFVFPKYLKKELPLGEK